jgi:hypothetical protein
MLGRVVGVIDEEVYPFAHDAQGGIPSGVIGRQGGEVFGAKEGQKFFAGRFRGFVLWGDGSEGKGEEGEKGEGSEAAAEGEGTLSPKPLQGQKGRFAPVLFSHPFSPPDLSRPTL